MCFSVRNSHHLSHVPREESPSSSFEATRLNSSTFRVCEKDAWGEHPFIYVKLYTGLVFIFDTGCNKPEHTDTPVSSLREFLETCPVADNENIPLNPAGKGEYLVVLSHCHYDHIGGLINFGSRTTFGAGRALKYDIIDKGRLRLYSLHQDLSLPEPQLPEILPLEDGQFLKSRPLNADAELDLGLQVILSPGHTIDSIVILDHTEKVAFMGDSAYERVNLFYSYGSDPIQHQESLRKVERHVQQIGVGESGTPWIAACGHITSGIELLPLTSRIICFIDGVLSQRLSPLEGDKDHLGRSGSKLFKDDGLAMSCPKQLYDDSVARYRQE